MNASSHLRPETIASAKAGTHGDGMSGGWITFVLGNDNFAIHAFDWPKLRGLLAEALKAVDAEMALAAPVGPVVTLACAHGKHEVCGYAGCSCSCHQVALPIFRKPTTSTCPRCGHDPQFCGCTLVEVEAPPAPETCMVCNHMYCECPESAVDLAAASQPVEGEAD